jgi:aconitate hydratase
MPGSEQSHDAISGCRPAPGALLLADQYPSVFIKITAFSMTEGVPMSYSDAFGVLKELSAGGKTVSYFALPELSKKFSQIERFPISIRVLLESVLRNINENEVTSDHLKSFLHYDPNQPGDVEIPYTPARVLLQDFTGVPCVVDLAALRSAMKRMGGDPSRINPQLPVNLVIDHSVSIDFYGHPEAFRKNAEREFERNRERYEFLRWGQGALENFHVVPPASGICHQVNLEYLGKVAQTKDADGRTYAYFDTLVGTDSHTTMINGLGILGWGVGGIEAEAAMLGQPIYMLAPPVVGVRLTGSLPSGTTATDLVLRVTEMLRAHGVVGKIVEYFGPGLDVLTVPDRATLANMAPEYGATAGFFPVDRQTLDYMHATGRDEDVIELAEAYCRAQGVFREGGENSAEYEAVLELDLGSIVPAVAGPKRPQDRIELSRVAGEFERLMSAPVKEGGFEEPAAKLGTRVKVTLADGRETEMTHGDVVIASITSCTNTSNPSVLMGAGLLAKKAVEKGLKTKPFVKTSFAPGSVVVTEYLKTAGLMPYLEELGFHLVGYGCTTCIGNSGPLPEEVSAAIEDNGLVAAAVLSGNRNFEGRVNPNTRANFLASPPLCVAYAIAGNMNVNLDTDPLGTDADGNPVYLKDIWPTNEELADYVSKAMDREAFRASYGGIEDSNPEWNRIELTSSEVYDWKDESTYIQEPPFFVDMPIEVKPIAAIHGARVLVKVADSVTTDHISPAGVISPDSPAGKYLAEKGVKRFDFNSYGSRRGNDRIMTRGTFANIRLRNQLAPGTEGSWTFHHPSGEKTSIYEASLKYKEAGTPTIVLAGKDYGMGSSRDWAAKGVYLLGVKAVIAESFERIHRSNLIGMGVLPLMYQPGETAESLGLAGDETFAIHVGDSVQPKELIHVEAVSPEGKKTEFKAICRIDSSVEVQYYRNGGILHTVLRNFVKNG